MNKVILKGRLIADPELKKTPTGVAVCSFCIAVNRRFARDTTDFINCEAWRQTGEFVQKYFTKGQEMLLCGELHIDKYNKGDESRTIAKISVDDVHFCGNKSQGNGDVKSYDNMQSAGDIEDLPF